MGRLGAAASCARFGERDFRQAFGRRLVLEGERFLGLEDGARGEAGLLRMPGEGLRCEGERLLALHERFRLRTGGDDEAFRLPDGERPHLRGEGEGVRRRARGERLQPALRCGETLREAERCCLPGELLHGDANILRERLEAERLRGDDERLLGEGEPLREAGTDLRSEPERQCGDGSREYARRETERLRGDRLSWSGPGPLL